MSDPVARLLHPKWIRFNEAGTSPSGKTLQWTVRSVDGNTLLGRVGWSGRWRRYVFLPEVAPLMFEQDCLRDIATFIEARTREHREAKVS